MVFDKKIPTDTIKLLPWRKHMAQRWLPRARGTEAYSSESSRIPWLPCPHEDAKLPRIWFEQEQNHRNTTAKYLPIANTLCSSLSSPEYVFCHHQLLTQPPRRASNPLTWWCYQGIPATLLCSKATQCCYCCCDLSLTTLILASLQQRERGKKKKKGPFQVLAWDYLSYLLLSLSQELS